MRDCIVRGTAADGQLRVFAITSADMVEKARQIHNTSPVVTAALGRLLSGAAMMGCMMKSPKDVLTLKLEGDGPVKGICVTANANADVKGFVGNPNVCIPAKPNGKLDVSGAVGKGYLNVIRDTGMKEPYNGRIEIVSGEIAQDLTYYYAVSEQIPSSVGLGVLLDKSNFVRSAGGFIIQVLPDASDEIIDKLEESLKNITSVTDMLEGGMSPQDMLQHILDGIDLEILDVIDTEYKCDCSLERVRKAISTISKKDIQEMIDDGKPIEVDCQFCGAHYVFEKKDLEEMLEN